MQSGKITADMEIKEFLSVPPDWMQKHSLRQIDLRQVKPSISKPHTMESNVQIQADEISFCYDKSNFLWENVSFTAKGGDIVGVVGKNGAGKSTLFRVLMGLDKQRRGNILFNGERASPKRRRKLSFYSMQDVDYQLFAATVLEEMLLDTANGEEDRKKALCVLKRFGLFDYAQMHPSQLSGGQKQRLSVALAYMSNADILFMDEPTSGLDEENMRLVSLAITELAEKGCCLFVITHDYEFAAHTFRSLLIIEETKEILRIPPERYNEKILCQIFDIAKENEK